MEGEHAPAQPFRQTAARHSDRDEKSDETATESCDKAEFQRQHGRVDDTRRCKAR